MNTSKNMSKRGNKGYKGVVVAIVLLLGIIFMASVPLSAQALSIKDRDTRGISRYKASDLKVGDYVDNFGTYSTKGVNWRVISSDTNGVLLRTDTTLSQADGTTDYMAYSTPKTGVFINERIYHRQNPGSEVIDDKNRAQFRDADGTNYWEQSDIRDRFNTLYKTMFSTAQKAVINETPQVKQLLYWTESDYYYLNLDVRNRPTSDGKYETPQYSDYTVGKMPDKVAVSTFFTSAEEFSGKKTYKSSDGDYDWAYANGLTTSSVAEQPRYTAYYYADDPMFLAPISTIEPLRTSDLKNAKGQQINVGLDASGEARNVYSSTPSFNGTSINRTGSTQILGYSDTGELRSIRASSVYSVMPSIYISNDTVLQRTGTRAHTNEKNTYYTYTLDSSQAQTKPEIIDKGELSLKGTVDRDYSFDIGTNTKDLVMNVSKGALPDGMTLVENSNSTSGYRIAGKATKAGTFNFTLQVENNFGTSTQDLSIVVAKGQYSGVSLPTVSAEVGQSTDNITLPTGWKFKEKQTFGDATQFKVEGIYNLDSSNYEDFAGIITVNVSSKLQPKPPANELPSLTYKVGQKVSSVILPQYYEYVDGNKTFASVGNGKGTVSVILNTAPSQYDDLIFDLDVTIAKGDAQTPPSTPSLTATYGQSASNIASQLPSGWKFKDASATFDKVGSGTIDAIYNTDATNYEDTTKALTVVVGKADQSAPSSVPSNIVVKVDAKLSTFTGLPTGFKFADPDMTFESAGQYDITLLYNTNATNYNDYTVNNVTVNVELLGAKTPSSIPENVTGFVGQDAEWISQGLPNNWYVAENILFEEAGVVDVKVYYNEDISKYENYNTTIKVTVYPSQHSEPTEIPSFDAQIGQHITDLQEQLDKLNASVGKEAYWFDEDELADDIVFDSVGTVSVSIYYNTDKANYAPWKGSVNVYVDLRDAQAPDGLPELKAKFGADTDAIVAQLPSGWSFVGNTVFGKPSDYDDNNDEGVDIEVDAVYNPDKSMYKDYITSLSVRVAINGFASDAPDKEFVADVNVGDQYNKIKLPVGYSWKTGFNTNETVGYEVREFLLEVNYNADPSVYYAISVDIKVVVNDGYLFFRLYNQGKLNIPLVATITGLSVIVVVAIAMIVAAQIKKRSKDNAAIVSRATSVQARANYGNPNGTAGYGQTTRIEQLPPSAGGYGNTQYGNTMQVPPTQQYGRTTQVPPQQGGAQYGRTRQVPPQQGGYPTSQSRYKK